MKQPSRSGKTPTSISPNLRQQEPQEDIREDAARARREKEGDDIDGVACRSQPHKECGDGVRRECAEDARAEGLGDTGDAEAFRIVVGKPARERTDHAAGKCHEAAEPRDVAQETRGKRDADRPHGTEEDGGEDVDEVLHGGAAAAEYGDAEQSAEHGDGDEDAGKGEFAGTCV